MYRLLVGLLWIFVCVLPSHTDEGADVQLVRNMIAAANDRDLDSLDQFVAADVVRARLIGIQSGPMGPFPPTDKSVELPFMGILRIKDGGIAEIWVEWDNLAALTQLGHFPPPENGSRQA